jgi:hypothetical protein
MAKHVHTVLTWNTISGVPQDAVQFTFNWQKATDFLTADYTAVETRIKNFFTVLNAGQTNALAYYLSPTLSRSANQVTLRHYNLDGHESGTAHGSPVRTTVDAYNVAAAASVQPPSEVAVCLSYATAYTLDPEFAPGARPRARDRGRLFFGPVSSAALTQDGTTKRVFVSATMRTDMVAAAKVLQSATDPLWSVWSRRNAVLFSVTNVWVDDAFDTQRRRGEKALIKTSGLVP